MRFHSTLGCLTLSAFAGHFEESGVQAVEDLKDRAARALGRAIQKSAFIGVYRRPVLSSAAG
jgi:hypothetical protein